MEDVLEVYQRPHNPTRPVVCLDETAKQLISETRVPIAAKPGQVARYDYEYERNGTANLFMMFAPLEGWRHVKVTDRHAAVDYAQVLKELSDTHFPHAEKIVLVQDNLNTPRRSSSCRTTSTPYLYPHRGKALRYYRTTSCRSAAERRKWQIFQMPVAKAGVCCTCVPRGFPQLRRTDG